MDALHAIVLALVQGLTEFLPVSSSAHLILLPRILGWEDQGLAFDVAVHVGTEVAVVAYFRRDLVGLARDWLASVARREAVGSSRLAWGIGIGTVPVGLAGLLLGDVVEAELRSPVVIAVATIVFGLALWWADNVSRRERSERDLGWVDFLVVGCAQALALVPGTSRSGITITAALALGLDRASAARFSFLLAVPVIFLAGGSKAVDLARLDTAVDWPSLLLGGAVAAVAAFACIHYFLKALDRIGMLPFIAYRLALGAVLLGMFL